MPGGSAHHQPLCLADVMDVAWSPHDAWLASCSVDNTVVIWNAVKFPGEGLLRAADPRDGLLEAELPVGISSVGPGQGDQEGRGVLSP